MSIVDRGRAVLRLQYQVTCLPLRLIERQTRSLGTESRVHLFAERVVATLDGGVGKFLGDSTLAEPGRARTPARRLAESRGPAGTGRTAEACGGR